MAIIDSSLISLLDGAMWVRVVWNDHDDENYVGDLVRFYGANNHPTLTLFGAIRRGNSQIWREVSLAPGESFEQNAGGPVRQWDDLSDIRVWC